MPACVAQVGQSSGTAPDTWLSPPEELGPALSITAELTTSSLAWEMGTSTSRRTNTGTNLVVFYHEEADLTVDGRLIGRARPGRGTASRRPLPLSQNLYRRTATVLIPT